MFIDKIKQDLDIDCTADEYMALASLSLFWHGDADERRACAKMYATLYVGDVVTVLSENSASSIYVLASLLDSHALLYKISYDRISKRWRKVDGKPKIVSLSDIEPIVLDTTEEGTPVEHGVAAAAVEQSQDRLQASVGSWIINHNKENK